MILNEYTKNLLGNYPEDRAHILAAIDAFCQANQCDTNKEIGFEERVKIFEAVKFLKRGYENLIFQLRAAM